MGIFEFISRLLGRFAPNARSAPEPGTAPARKARSKSKGESPAVQRARRSPTFLPPARRIKPGRKRYSRPRAQYDPDGLDRFELPHLGTPRDLARALDVSEGKLVWLTWAEARGQGDHYHRREVPKASGGTRLLCVPKPQTRAAQDWILDEILKRIPVNACAHGFIKGRSIVSNARQHTGRDIVINIDLQDFFPSISIGSVIGLFEWMGYSKKVAWHLGMLCTCPYGRRRALPQGSPTSPAISNLVCWKLDRRLTGLAKRFGMSYTRYADDMTLSGSGRLIARPGRLIRRVEGICKAEGFRVNARKTRVMRKGRKQTVTGLVVNDAPSLSREELRKLRAILHNCRTKGVSSQNRDNAPGFEESLRGKIALVRMVNPEKADKFMEDFAVIDWSS